MRGLWSLMFGALLVWLGPRAWAQPPGFPQVYVVSYEIVGEGTIVVSPASDDSRTAFTADTANVTYSLGPGEGLLLNLQFFPSATGHYVRWEVRRVGQAPIEDIANPTTLYLDPEYGSPSFWVVRAIVTAPYVFYESFSEHAGWTATGLWHFCSDACFGCSLLQGRYAYYAWPGTCSYASSVRTRGFLTSPIIPVPANTDLVVQFDLARVVESLPRVTRDRTYVQLRIGKGAWRTIWSRSSQNPSPECQTFAFGFNTKRNTQIQIRFVFDSVRRDSSALPGWAVDNVVVMPRSLVPTGVAVAEEYLDLDLEEGESPWFVLTVTPNPLTSGRNVVFALDGVEAEAIRVEVYDVSGRLVYKGEGVGNQLTWNLTDTTGRLVGNGLYLALAYVRMNGEWIASDLEKVLILR